ncbi:7-carboxy-7-deazaguanine synthase [Sandaracinobacter sp. RS1-74]|uniref:7-carboxy-7-deazaguanine synthase n=1 Tax=Sandaracinobacteroides sayramensis TaxID=2913411 RepID=UPI001EDB677B|nr:7-carboxy-7-deazaguanine synthase [Sandaracinobacteroides sayramensis]MCG2841738.1 7-carboxy-7-deazaguanine synthase [Sandaracinobacteroides sayramensis]
MSYAVKELFLTLQGEGAQTGMRAVFLRFAGCNLWTGREQDRAEAVCQFCDTDFVGMDGEGGGRFQTADDLATAVEAMWGAERAHRLVVCTGGEPLLQLDPPLIAALHAKGFRVAVESNGTVEAPDGIDWLCISPKAGAEIVQRRGDELKLVYPQPTLLPPQVESWDFAHFFVQPMDGPAQLRNIAAAIDWCLANPKWRLSLQTHKVTGIP